MALIFHCFHAERMWKDFLVIIAALWYSLLDLLSPVKCAGCELWDEWLCENCRQSCQRPWKAGRFMPGWSGPEPVWALDKYRGSARKIILTLKHDSRTDLLPWLELVGSKASQKIPKLFKTTEPICLVPAPSSWKRKLSGQEVVKTFVTYLADFANQAGQEIKVEPCLRLRLGARGQSGKDKRARLGGRQGSIRCNYKPAHPVILVDDVAATGATLQEARRAIELCGGEVLGAIVLAAPLPKEK